jgi:hypothetical protein
VITTATNPPFVCRSVPPESPSVKRTTPWRHSNLQGSGHYESTGLRGQVFSSSLNLRDASCFEPLRDVLPRHCARRSLRTDRTLAPNRRVHRTKLLAGREKLPCSKEKCDTESEGLQSTESSSVNAGRSAKQGAQTESCRDPPRSGSGSRRSSNSARHARFATTCPSAAFDHGNGSRLAHYSIADALFATTSSEANDVHSLSCSPRC